MNLVHNQQWDHEQSSSVQLHISKQHTTTYLLSEIYEAAFCHMLTLQVNILNKQEYNMPYPATVDVNTTQCTGKPV